MGNGIVKRGDLSDELITELDSKFVQLSGNDLKARDDIMDIKLKLREQSATNFLNKSGVGFYDTFIDNSSIDAGNTTSTYNSTNKAVDFTGSKSLKMVDESFDTFNNLDIALYPSKINKCTVSGAVNNSITVNLSDTDKTLNTGDKLFMENVLNEVLNSVQNYTNYDRTTPISVVGSAYTTSATARPQYLSNGWIVICVYDGNTTLKLYVCKDGTTFEPLCSLGSTTFNSFAMCSYGNVIYVLGINASYTSNYFAKIDATTVTNTLYNLTVLDSSQTSFGTGCSIAVSSTGVLTAVWSSKNSTYPNTFNLRSAKSLDGGVTWTTQSGSAGVDQVTTANASGNVFASPYVLYDKNDKPIIFATWNDGTTYVVNSYSYVNNWSPHTIQYLNYAQYNPVATLQKYGANAGRLWVVWLGADSTDTNTNNVKASYSDDNGVTWSTLIKLTSGNSYNQGAPTITTDINGYVYVLMYGFTSANNTKLNIRSIKSTDGINWGSITEVTNQSTGNIQFPSICDNYYNFTTPITIWQDTANSRVAFYGKWQARQGYTLTMKNAVTLADGDKVPIVDLIPQQNNVDLTIDSIDSEKFSFKGNSLNATVASIKINGKDNSLNALAYAVA